MNFYKHYIGDYARDTKGLSIVEHGAYLLLLQHVYATENRLPDDRAQLYRIAGAITTPERRAVDKVADLFFPVNGDGRRHNKRAEEEIEKHRAQAQANRIVAEQREAKRRVQREANDIFNDSSTNRSPNHSQKPEESKTFPANAGKGRGAAATVPDCPHEKLIALYEELLPTCPKVVEWNEERQRIMRARWREQSQSNGKRPGYTTEEEGLVFWRRYFVYAARSPFLTGKSAGRDGGAPFVATLEWLVRPKNFAKVVEGNYHRDVA